MAKVQLTTRDGRQIRINGADVASVEPWNDGVGRAPRDCSLVTMRGGDRFLAAQAPGEVLRRINVTQGSTPARAGGRSNDLR